MMTLAALALFYFLPTIIATQRGHRAGGVAVVNFLFGWTGIGWLALLLWALLSRPPCYYLPVYYRYAGWRKY